MQQLYLTFIEYLPCTKHCCEWFNFSALIFLTSTVWNTYFCCCCVVVQSLSCVRLFVTPWTAAHQASLSFTISRSLLKPMSIELVVPSNHLILRCPLLLLLSIRVFSDEVALHIKLLKYWSFSFSISPSSENSGFISFRIDWFDLLAVQGTLESVLQYHNLKASIQAMVFFQWSCKDMSVIVVLSLGHVQFYGKIVALIIQTFVSKVMSLLFNMAV